MGSNPASFDRDHPAVGLKTEGLPDTLVPRVEAAGGAQHPPSYTEQPEVLKCLPASGPSPHTHRDPTGSRGGRQQLAFTLTLICVPPKHLCQAPACLLNASPPAIPVAIAAPQPVPL